MNRKSTNFGIRRRLSRVCSTHLPPGSRNNIKWVGFTASYQNYSSSYIINCELYSFISKFRELWASTGRAAQLSAECHHGPATLALRAQLGRAPAPADRRPQAQRQPPGLRRRRGPAHKRRQVRRAAVRTAAAAAEQAASYEAIAEEVANPVTEEVIDTVT